MAVSPTTVRQTIETALIAALGALTPPWQVSRLSCDMFPGADPLQLEALSFAVGLRDTDFSAHRQTTARGQRMATTGVVVRFASQLRADNHVADYDTALTREAVLVATLGTITGAPILLESITRDARSGDGTRFVGEVLATVFHGYPI